MSTIATTVPGFAKAVSPVWNRNGVFTRSLSSFIEAKRDAAHAAGFRAVAAQLANTPLAKANEKELVDGALRSYRSRGWAVVGWGTFGQDTDAFLDGLAAIACVIRLDLEGWIANGEAWAEGPTNRHKTADFMRGWNAGLGGRHPPLMLSCLSSTTSNYGRNMDFVPFVNYAGAAVSPQVYCASQPAYTLPAMRDSFAKTTVPVKLLVPTLNVVPGGPLPTRYKRWRGMRWLWTGEDTLPDQFAKVLVMA